MQKPQLVALDTNVLMRLADGHEATIDAWQLMKRRIQAVQFMVLPTVMDELAIVNWICRRPSSPLRKTSSRNFTPDNQV